MPTQHRRQLRKAPRLLAATRNILTRVACSLRQLVHRWQRGVPIVVLIADRPRQAALRRELDLGVRRLRRVLNETFPADIAVVAQQVIATDHQLAGCYQVGQRPDGTRFALIRLAWQVSGRRLTTDDRLAPLAEQCIALATQGSGPSVLGPIDLEPAPLVEPRQHPPLPADPLAPSPNGISRHDLPRSAQRRAVRSPHRKSSPSRLRLSKTSCGKPDTNGAGTRPA